MYWYWVKKKINKERRWKETGLKHQVELAGKMAFEWTHDGSKRISNMERKRNLKSKCCLTLTFRGGANEEEIEKKQAQNYEET